MKNTRPITLMQKVFINIGLILLGISANTTFFILMVTFLLGTVILGFLSSQPERFTLNTKKISKEKERETLPTTSSINSK